MAIANGYATLAEIQARLGISSDTTILENIVEAVSRQFDNWCNRRFYKNTGDETRYYTSEDTWSIWTDDIVSVTTIGTDEDGDHTYEISWATTDFDLHPFNAVLDGKPYTSIGVTQLGRYRFPLIDRAVAVTGVFGWNAIPDPVNEACLIQSERIYRRKDSPFGVAGTPEFGQLRLLARLDPDVEMLLSAYRRFDLP